MRIYIDKEYRCHTQPAQGLRAVDTSFFDNKCKRLVEGYRYLPHGETWTREDGEQFVGEMIAPLEDCATLRTAQQVYEVLLPELNELREGVEAIRESFEGLSSNPGLEQLMDFIENLREIMEELHA